MSFLGGFFGLLVLALATIAVGGCGPRHRYYYEDERYGYGHHRMDDRDAWEIVRNDPCRYDEYRRFAAKHENPDKRREVVWKLARDGCSHPNQYYDRDYDRDYGYGDYDDRRY